MNREVSRTEAWLMATRPQTLPASAAPVVVGSGLAVHDGVFAPLPAIAALLGALFLQVGTNFANDYQDARTGADTADREGFTRVTQAGIIPPQAVRRAAFATFGGAVAVGTVLVAIGGLPVVVIGLASIAAGLLYTGGPYPYGYYGLGDLFVFVFFGIVAVSGTYYVQAVASTPGLTVPLGVPPGTIPPTAILASLPAAGLITAVLVVNNIRDRETDARTGKRTLAVRIGYRWSRIQFICLLGLAYIIPFVFVTTGHHPAVLLPLATLPLAIAVTRTVLGRTDGEALNPALERVGRLAAAHSVLFAAGFAVPTLL